MLKMIVATSNDLSIGFKNMLPWPRNRADMHWFKSNTSGDLLVMGRKTWESIGSKPLDDRLNFVVTRNPSSISSHYRPDGILSPSKDKDLVEHVKELDKMFPNKDVWVIGGANIYSQLYVHCEELYLTTIFGKYDSDTHLNRDILDYFSKKVFEQVNKHESMQILKKDAND